VKTWDDVPGAIRRVLRRADFTTPYDSGEDRPVAGPDEANIITSVVERQLPLPKNLVRHAPVIDLDIPCILLDSSTPGHHHLIIDKEISWSAYLKVLGALADAGLVEDGYRDASEKRGYSAIRLPWVKKEEVSENEWPRLPECTCDQLAHPCEVHDCLGGPDF